VPDRQRAPAAASSGHIRPRHRSRHLLATELLFPYIYCLADDAIKAGVLSVPRRPGPAPACTDAAFLTIAPVLPVLGRRSENGFLEQIRRDWAGLFPHLPDQPEVTAGPAGCGCLRAVPRRLRTLGTR
jgi:hypothetical protein